MRNRKEVVMEGKDDLVSSLKCYLLGSFHSEEWSSLVNNSCSTRAFAIYAGAVPKELHSFTDNPCSTRAKWLSNKRTESLSAG